MSSLRCTTLQLHPPKQLIERNAQADVKFTEFGVLGADWIKTHLINDRLNIECIVRKERDAPLRVVQTCRAGDQLQNASRVFSSNATMTRHQPFALLEWKGKPVLARGAAL